MLNLPAERNFAKLAGSASKDKRFKNMSLDLVRDFTDFNAD
ncbi:uncharacterized protein METZ01_LOCUS89909 [marine metagenome]|uniref:Uncharacterized protein n=1 Tax=marine metagenome TaxID=408172 RepID=A0A381V9J0_9ZZZZ